MGLISDILGTFADAADEIASIANDKDCDWYCDECGAYMNDQPGFTTEDDEWECTECGYLNDVSEDNIIEKDLHNNSGNAFLIHNGTKFASNILTKRNYIYNASMVVIRQSTFYNIDESLYQDFHSCGDWGFWMGACIQGNVIEICEKLSYYRIHESNETARASRTGTDWLEVAVLLTRFKDILRLKGYKLRVFRGKWTRDLGLSKITNKTFYLTNYPEVFGGTKLDIYLYKISTVIDFMYNRLHL